MVRQGRSIAVVGVLLIWCAVLLLVVGCAGTSSGASKKEQGRSPQATTSEEEARCEGTRTLHLYFVNNPNGLPTDGGQPRFGSEEDMRKADKKAGQKVDDLGLFTTNDLPGCPKGGLLKGTDKPDKLEGGLGNDIIYGGNGDDKLDLWSSEGEDVIYGGDGNDFLFSFNVCWRRSCSSNDGQRDKLYCGKGKDTYWPDKNNYVDSSCEKKIVGHSA